MRRMLLSWALKWPLLTFSNLNTELCIRHTRVSEAQESNDPPPPSSVGACALGERHSGGLPESTLPDTSLGRSGKWLVICEISGLCCSVVKSSRCSFL